MPEIPSVIVKGIDRKLDGSQTDVEIEMRQAAAALLEFSFDFETKDLEKGIEFYVPTPKEWLYDAWVDVEEVFNTPVFVDVAIVPKETGLLYSIMNSSYLLNQPISSEGLSNDLRSGSGSFMADGDQMRLVPARFLTTDPLKLYVSQDGKCDGSGIPIDATVGKASFHAIIFF